MQIPDYLLQHTLIVEPALGGSSHGPEYGDETVYPAFIDDNTSLQLDQEGNEIVSSSRVFIKDLNAIVPLQSRAIPIFMRYLVFAGLTVDKKEEVKASGRESLVIDVKRRDGGSLPVPSHLEIVLR